MNQKASGLLSGVSLVFVVILALAGNFAAPAISVADDAKKTVSLAVDYGDGVQKHFTALPWREELTVLDAMRAAEKHPRGIKLQSRGSGATALLLAIDDVKNEGGGGKGWMYRVNGKLADRGAGVYVLRPGDAVLWTFEKYR